MSLTAAAKSLGTISPRLRATFISVSPILPIPLRLLPDIISNSHTLSPSFVRNTVIAMRWDGNKARHRQAATTRPIATPEAVCKVRRSKRIRPSSAFKIAVVRLLSSSSQRLRYAAESLTAARHSAFERCATSNSRHNSAAKCVRTPRLNKVDPWLSSVCRPAHPPVPASKSWAVDWAHTT